MSHSPESLVASPEDVACYEECVTDEVFSTSTDHEFQDNEETEPSRSSTQCVEQDCKPGSPSHRLPKASNSGRISKKGELDFYSYCI